MAATWSSTPRPAQIRQTLHPIGADDTVSLAFAPDGTLATGTRSGIVQLWNPISGEQVAGPVPVTAGPVTSIAFDPTGQRFATTGSQDGTVKLWSTSTLQQEGTALNTDQRAGTTAAFEPGGKQPARRRRPRQRLHLADVARRLGATRLHGRRTQPDPRGMGPVRPRTCLRKGLPLSQQADIQR